MCTTTVQTKLCISYGLFIWIHPKTLCLPMTTRGRAGEFWGQNRIQMDTLFLLTVTHLSICGSNKDIDSLLFRLGKGDSHGGAAGCRGADKKWQPAASTVKKRRHCFQTSFDWMEVFFRLVHVWACVRSKGQCMAAVDETLVFQEINSTYDQ